MLRQAGLAISRVELIHLNKDYRHPGSGDLLVRSDVTEAGEAFVPWEGGWAGRVAGMVRTTATGERLRGPSGA